MYQNGAGRPARRRPRLLLADDHALLLVFLKKLLDEDYFLVGTATNGKALVAAARKLRPDVIVLDISLPLLNGLEAARKIRKADPAVKLLFLTVHADRGYVEEAFRVGALGYVTKESAATELLSALRSVLQGRAYVTPMLDKDRIRDLRGSTVAS